MISYTKGNLLEADTDALVNTVNCVGVMGKGIALAFKSSFPENFKEYESACKKNEVVIGEMFVTRVSEGKWIVNFPTKQPLIKKSLSSLTDVSIIVYEK